MRTFILIVVRVVIVILGPKGSCSANEVVALYHPLAIFNFSLFWLDFFLFALVLRLGSRAFYGISMDVLDLLGESGELGIAAEKRREKMARRGEKGRDTYCHTDTAHCDPGTKSFADTSEFPEYGERAVFVAVEKRRDYGVGVGRETN